MGLLVSTKANSQAEAMQLALLSFLPSIFFSGYTFPPETMPQPFYLLSYAVPATYVRITRGVIVRGAGLAHLWGDGLGPARDGLRMLLWSAKRFKKIIAP